MTISHDRVMDDAREPAPENRPRVPERYPWLSFTLIALCVAATVPDMIATRSLMAAGPIAERFAVFGPYVVQGQWYRVLAATLAHFGIIHLLMNGASLWNLGRIFERLIGPWRLATISLITAFGSSAMALLFSWDRGAIGISGVLCGWLGALFAASTTEGRRALMTTLIQIAVISLLPMVSWQAHLGGFLFGLPIGYALRYRQFPLIAAAMVLLGIAACVLGAYFGPMFVRGEAGAP